MTKYLWKSIFRCDLRSVIRISGYILIAVVLFLVVIINAFPQWLGHSTQVDLYNEEGEIRSVSVLVQAPDYVEDLVDYLNSSSKKGGVVILPKLGSVRGYDWPNGYFGFDVYYLSQARPVLTSYRWGRQEPHDKIYDLINTALMKEFLDFNEILTLLNIKYIIVAEDALRWGNEIFDIDEIHKLLSENKQVRLVKRFGKHVLYETTGAPSMFYPVTQAILLPSQVEYPKQSAETKFFGPEELFSREWIQHEAVQLNLSDSSLDAKYVYTLDRIEKGWWLTRTSNNVPLSITTDEYPYLYVTAKTQKGVGLRIGIKNSIDDDTEVLKPINPNNESESYAQQNLAISTSDYYIFQYDLTPYNRVDFIEIGLGVTGSQPEGEYQVSIQDMSFGPYYSLQTPSTAVDILSFLSRQQDPRSTVIVKNEEEVLNGGEEVPTITTEEINPTSFNVQVDDAKSTFLLMSTIFYDDNWIAEINGDQLPHIKADELFNTWIVRETGEFEIKIYYRAQQYIQYFYCISGTFITVVCVILLWLRFKPRIHKVLSRKGVEENV